MKLLLITISIIFFGFNANAKGYCDLQITDIINFERLDTKNDFSFNMFLSTKLSFQYEMSKCVEGDTLSIVQGAFSSTFSRATSSKAKYLQYFNKFIAQNCNLQSPIISDFMNLTEKNSGGKEKKEYVTTIICEYTKKKYRTKKKE
jgi:hypothetical protein